MANVPLFRDYHQGLYAIPVLRLESRLRSDWNLRKFYPRLLKLHGSVNWWYSGAPSFAGESLFDSGVTPGWSIEAADNADALFEDALEKVPFIVPPTNTKSVFFRNEAIRAQWRVAAKALEAAETIYLLGYSLPDGDNLVRTFLASTSAGKRLVPVDIDTAVVGRLRQFRRHQVDADFIKPDRPLAFFAESLV
jgi:hypothetical protein